MAEKLSTNNLWLSDIDKIIHSLPELDTLSGKSIMITGANGLICSAVVDILIRYNETHTAAPVHITAAGRSPERLRERFGKFSGKKYFSFMNYDASRDRVGDFHADYIIHGASNATPASMSAEPVETMLANMLNPRSCYPVSKRAAETLCVSYAAECREQFTAIH